MGLMSTAVRGRVARRAAVLSVAVAAVVYVGGHASGSFRPVPDAVAVRVAAPGLVTASVGWHRNTGAARSPVVGWMLAGPAGALTPPAQPPVPTAETLRMDR